VNAVEERLAAVLATHFDPRWGSRFWLERAAGLGFDPRRELRRVADLARLGPTPLEELATRPVEHFLPRRFHDVLHECVTSETGGTTGPPRRTLFLHEEFDAAFVTPFLRAAELLGFPRRVHWLFVGPSGPHVIGKAARACAAALQSLDPFSVDFDPRWARKLPADSLARRRYLEHVLEQALAILASQEIGVLFATPPVLSALGERLAAERCAGITGIHLGGMAAPAGFWKELGERFPNASVLGGYGNSLAGVCPQVSPDPDALPEYFPCGARLVLEVETEGSRRGRVRFHRLDLSCFLPNVLERDVAESVAPPTHARAAGFDLPGLRDPRPPEDAAEARSPGLY
jgi:hypothetical protein